MSALNSLRLQKAAWDAMLSGFRARRLHSLCAAATLRSRNIFLGVYLHDRSVGVNRTPPQPRNRRAGGVSRWPRWLRLACDAVSFHRASTQSWLCKVAKRRCSA